MAGESSAAGAVVTPGHRVPAGHLALGIPARPVRPLSDGERANIAAIRDRYVALKEHYRLQLAGAHQDGADPDGAR